MNGCLRLDGRWLIIWPPGTILDQVSQPARIVSASTGLGVRIGERIAIDGQGVTAPLTTVDSQGCAGPHWVGASEFARSAEINWVSVDATGPFAIRMPASLTRTPVEGVDSQFDLYEQPSLALGFEYGGVGCRAAQPGEDAFTAVVDGRPVRFIREVGELPRPINLVAVFPAAALSRDNQPNTCLTVTAQCAADHDCDLARAIVDSIRFD